MCVCGESYCLVQSFQVASIILSNHVTLLDEPRPCPDLLRLPRCRQADSQREISSEVRSNQEFGLQAMLAHCSGIGFMHKSLQEHVHEI